MVSEQNFAFLRPVYYGGIQRTGRPGSREKEIEFKRVRARGRRDRKDCFAGILARSLVK